MRCLLHGKVKELNRISGDGTATCPFYERIDDVLNGRVPANPEPPEENAASGGISVPIVSANGEPRVARLQCRARAMFFSTYYRHLLSSLT